jgi:hypothetical protein
MVMGPADCSCLLLRTLCPNLTAIVAGLVVGVNWVRIVRVLVLGRNCRLLQVDLRVLGRQVRSQDSHHLLQVLLQAVVVVCLGLSMVDCMDRLVDLDHRDWG